MTSRPNLLQAPLGGFPAGTRRGSGLFLIFNLSLPRQPAHSKRILQAVQGNRQFYTTRETTGARRGARLQAEDICPLAPHVSGKCPRDYLGHMPPSNLPDQRYISNGEAITLTQRVGPHPLDINCTSCAWVGISNMFLRQRKAQGKQ